MRRRGRGEAVQGRDRKNEEKRLGWRVQSIYSDRSFRLDRRGQLEQIKGWAIYGKVGGEARRRAGSS